MTILSLINRHWPKRTIRMIDLMSESCFTGMHTINFPLSPRKTCISFIFSVLLIDVNIIADGVNSEPLVAMKFSLAVTATTRPRCLLLPQTPFIILQKYYNREDMYFNRKYSFLYIYLLLSQINFS